MSQGHHARRPQAGGQDKPMRQEGGLEQDRPIRYGDVFNVSGDLATRIIAPEDANMMQSAENTVLGQTQKGGPAATMQSAGTRNEQAGFVSHRQASDAAADHGVSVTENDIPGARIVTESVAGQVLSNILLQ
ncbi:unnamed protein product [Dovyalis caffra]|uniref:SMP domain-containing protein n=1 Tax=Dovyalis caffra TaxID=77055 RepID=A0AAV1R005_9ROSI|nr:unnamed protein product [Dovyalis caffra]